MSVFLNPLQNHDVFKLKPESKVLFIFKVLYFKEQRTSAFPTHPKREEQHSKRERERGRNEEGRKRMEGREGKIESWNSGFSNRHIEIPVKHGLLDT